MAKDTLRYFTDLPVHRRPVSGILADPAVFADVPEDWEVITSDVRGSTQALNEGRHQVVNLVATGSIIAALNIAHRAGVALILATIFAVVIVAEFVVTEIRKRII
jgi:hypothetical protein